MKKDIETIEDVSTLIEVFYEAINRSPSLSPFFRDLSWGEHLPKMNSFWCFILLDQPGYTTNVVDKHLSMPLEKRHIEEWITLFHETIDSLFEGEKAQLGKERARLIGFGIEQKMRLFKNKLN
jgi:hemoglobin